MSRFDYVAYDQEAQKKQNEIKAKAQELEQLIEKNITCPDSKQKAINHLEVTYMWCGKGIRNDQIKRNGSAPLQEQHSNS